MAKRDDEVGYKRPPKSTRFKPGQSGNPKGRRKNVRNFKTDLTEELRETILIRENGKERRISKQRAFIKALVAMAIKSDVRAINAILSCTRNLGTMVEDDPTKQDIEDIDIIESFIARERKRKQLQRQTLAPSKSRTQRDEQ